MKRISLQWRITLMTVLLIGVTCVAMNLLLCFSGVYYMDTIVDGLQGGGTMILNEEGTASFDPQLVAPSEELTIVVDGAQGRFRTTNWYITAIVTLLSGILAYFVSGRALKPLHSFASQVEKVQLNNLADVRIDEDVLPEFRQLSHSFNQMLERLNNAFTARRQFTGNAAHELRTPMTTIKGFIDGMLDGTIPPEETKHYLGIVSQETGRLARLVQNMLDITKLEAGEVPIHAQTYDLWKTVTDVVLSDEQRIEDGKIDIRGLGGDPLLIYADPDFVHQVVYNIVDNAIKFTPAGGTISFAAERRGNMVEVRIENTGAGIAPEALPFVFERFYKEDRSRGMNTRGSGLGLHICKILVNLSGGQIHAESEEGNWCRFVFTLPAGQ